MHVDYSFTNINKNLILFKRKKTKTSLENNDKKTKQEFEFSTA